FRGKDPRGRSVIACSGRLPCTKRTEPVLHTGMKAAPFRLKEADEFVTQHRRHNNNPAVGCKFAVGAAENGKRVGVAVAGRPTCRRLVTWIRPSSAYQESETVWPQ